MAKDVRALREEAAEAAAAGKHKRALAAYLELERLEPRDAQWAKRAGETYRRLGNNKSAVDAFERSAERYAQNGFLVQAIAVCKLILQMDPKHESTMQRLLRMHEQIGQGPTRAQGLADNNLALHDDPKVSALRRAPTGGFAMIAPSNAVPDVPARGSASMPAIGEGTPTETPTLFRTRPKRSRPPIAMPRTKSKPIQLPPGAALETVDLSKQVPDSHDHSVPGVRVIPIDAEFAYPERDSEVEVAPPLRDSSPMIEIEPPDDDYTAEVDDATELELEDIEEIPLAEPRAIGAVALRALAATPLFANMPPSALEALVSELMLVPLEAGDVLFHEGDPGDALYVVAEGEVSVQAEGPPRVEMARLGPGTFLGEVALMTDQPRSATVTATEHAELLRIDRHTLSRVLANHGDVLLAVLRFVRDRLVDRWVRTSPLFRPFTDDQRLELAAKFKFLEIESGTVLLTAGSKPDGLYIVLAGQFLVQRDNAVVATLGPGELIGETALLAGGAFRSDVVANGKSLALCLPANLFRELIMTHPAVLE